MGLGLCARGTGRWRRMEDGKLHSERLSLSVIFFVDVEVSEVVKGRPQGPTRLHVVYLLC